MLLLLVALLLASNIFWKRKMSIQRETVFSNPCCCGQSSSCVIDTPTVCCTVQPCPVSFVAQPAPVPLNIQPAPVTCQVQPSPICACVSQQSSSCCQSCGAPQCCCSQCSGCCCQPSCCSPCCCPCRRRRRSVNANMMRTKRCCGFVKSLQNFWWVRLIQKNFAFSN